MSNTIVVGGWAFVADKEQGWLRGRVTAVDGTSATVGTEVGNRDGAIGKTVFPSPEKCNVDDLVFMHNISHESALVECLRQRYLETDTMYTYVGTGVLIAVNPFQPLAINDPHRVSQYRGRDPTEVDPHIFVLADQAYRRVTQDFQDQAFVVSGESGAGKTEACKLVMRFLSLVNAQMGSDGTIKSVSAESATADRLMSHVMATNPVLESFGNAKSVRNNNSSRFGKFLCMQYHDGRLVGATMKNYLLEKSRVVTAGPAERAYHIFYQLVAGNLAERLSADDKADLCLGTGTADQWKFLNGGECISIPGVDDADDWSETTEALNNLGVSSDERRSIIRILAAILHLGELEFKPHGGDRMGIADPSRLATIAALLGCDPGEFEHSLCYRHMIVQGEEFVRPNDTALCTDSRDTVARHLYSHLFDWIFSKLNVLLAPPTPKAANTKNSFFGILDIFGFEIFVKNSFEQLCINFTNEKLQNIFIQRVFMAEQAEYVSEGIPWESIDYDDNKPCCDLIEAHRVGILAMLDEEGAVPRGCDATWVEKLHNKFKANAFYDTPKLSKSDFVIQHYAGPVTYNSTGFMDKNKDSIHPDIVSVLATVDDALIFSMFEADMAIISEQRAAAKVGGGGQKPRAKPTAGLSFKADLKQLGDVLLATDSWYVRCIKPNQAKTPRTWDGDNVARQLRYNNVMETVRVRKLGYLYRRPFDFFIRRFWMCATDCPPLAFHPSRLANLDRKAAQGLIASVVLGDDIDRRRFVCGKTKVFIKTAVEVDELERIRNALFTVRCVKIQVQYKRYFWSTRFKAYRAASILLQAPIRRTLALRNYSAVLIGTDLLSRFSMRFQPHTNYRNLITGVSLIHAAQLRQPLRFEWVQVRASAKVITAKSTRRLFVFRRSGGILIRSFVRRMVAMRLVASLRLQSSCRRALEYIPYSNIPPAASLLLSLARRMIYTPRRQLWVDSTIVLQRHLQTAPVRRRHLNKDRAAKIAQAALRQWTRRGLHSWNRWAILTLGPASRRGTTQRELQRRREAVMVLQTVQRRVLEREAYVIARSCVQSLQRFSRRTVYERRRFKGIVACIEAQAIFRMAIYSAGLSAARSAAIELQQVSRRSVCSQSYIFSYSCVVSIESTLKRSRCQREYVSALAAVCILQTTIRSKLIRHILGARRIVVIFQQARIRRCSARLSFLMRRSAAIRVKSAARRNVYRATFGVHRLASSWIKSRVRYAGYRRYHIESVSAVSNDIAPRLLCLLMRSVFCRARFAASKLQTVARRNLIRRSLMTVIPAAPLLQGVLIRAKFSSLFNQARGATNVINGYTRRRAVQAFLRDCCRATIKLQASVRRLMIRSMFCLLRQAVTTLVAVGSRAVWRRQYVLHNSAANTLVCTVRRRSYNAEFAQALHALVVLDDVQRFAHERAATRIIQANAMAGVCRWWFIVGQCAAVSIQRHARRAVATAHMSRVRRAIHILETKTVRRHCQFQLSVVRDATIQVQSYLRAKPCWNARSVAIFSAMTLQTGCRRTLYFAMWRQGRSCGRLVQARMRCAVIRLFYLHLRRNSRIIQADVRRCHCREILIFQARSASILLQTVLRRQDLRSSMLVVRAATGTIVTCCRRTAIVTKLNVSRSAIRSLQAWCRQAVVRNDPTTGYIPLAWAGGVLTKTALRSQTQHWFHQLSTVTRILTKHCRGRAWSAAYAQALLSGQIIGECAKRTVWRHAFCTARQSAFSGQQLMLRSVAISKFRPKLFAVGILQPCCRRAVCFRWRSKLLFATAVLQACVQRSVCSTRYRKRLVGSLQLNAVALRLYLREMSYLPVIRSTLKLQASVHRARAYLQKQVIARAAVVLIARSRASMARRMYWKQLRFVIASECIQACLRRSLNQQGFVGADNASAVLRATIVARPRSRRGFIIARAASSCLKNSCQRAIYSPDLRRKRVAIARVQAFVVRMHVWRRYSNVCRLVDKLQYHAQRAVLQARLRQARVAMLVLQAAVRRTILGQQKLFKRLDCILTLQRVAHRAVVEHHFASALDASRVLVTWFLRQHARQKFSTEHDHAALLSLHVHRLATRRRYLATMQLRTAAVRVVHRAVFVTKFATASKIAFRAKTMLTRRKHGGRLAIVAACKWAMKRAVARKELVRKSSASLVVTRGVLSAARLRHAFLSQQKSARCLQSAVLRLRDRNNFAPVPSAGCKLRDALVRRSRWSRLPVWAEAATTRARFLAHRRGLVALALRIWALAPRARFARCRNLTILLRSVRNQYQQRQRYVRARSCLAGYMLWWDEDMGAISPEERWVVLKAGSFQSFRRLGDASPSFSTHVTVDTQLQTNGVSSKGSSFSITMVTAKLERCELLFESTETMLSWLQSLLYAQHHDWLSNRRMVRASIRCTDTAPKQRLQHISSIASEIRALSFQSRHYQTPQPTELKTSKLDLDGNVMWSSASSNLHHGSAPPRRATQLSHTSASTSTPIRSVPVSPELRTYLDHLHSGATAANAAAAAITAGSLPTTSHSVSRKLPFEKSTRLQKSPSQPIIASSTSYCSVVMLVSPVRVEEAARWVRSKLLSSLKAHTMGLQVVGPAAHVIRAAVAQESSEAAEEVTEHDGDWSSLLTSLESRAVTKDALVMLWDTSGEGTGPFAKILGSAGRIQLPTALNLDSAESLLLRFGLHLA